MLIPSLTWQLLVALAISFTFTVIFREIKPFYGQRWRPWSLCSVADPTSFPAESSSDLLYYVCGYQIILCVCALLLRRGENSSDGGASAASAVVLMGANVVTFAMVIRLNIK